MMVDESLNKQEIALYDYSQYKELKSIYANNITVSHICEKLSYFNINDSAIDAKTYMEENNYDYLGIEENGIIMGYINRSSLGNGIGKCKDYLIEFNSLNLISDSTPIIDLISILRDTPAIFVLVRNKVKNIVTRADLQKPPVRMLIFGYINILEMNLLQTINYFYKEDTWTDYISQNRLEKARTLYQERKARNEDITLSDCLQLCDKTRLILQNEKLLQFYGIESKNKGEKLFKKIEMLRNKLAHSQDIVIGSSWEEIFDIVKNIETLLDKSSKSANKTDIKSLSVNSKEMYYKRARE